MKKVLASEWALCKLLGVTGKGSSVLSQLQPPLFSPDAPSLKLTFSTPFIKLPWRCIQLYCRNSGSWCVPANCMFWLLLNYSLALLPPASANQVLVLWSLPLKPPCKMYLRLFFEKNSLQTIVSLFDKDSHFWVLSCWVLFGSLPCNNGDPKRTTGWKEGELPFLSLSGCLSWALNLVLSSLPPLLFSVLGPLGQDWKWYHDG